MKIRHVILALVIIAVLAFLSALGLLAEWFWFSTMGYESVFLTVITTRAILGITCGAVFFAVVFAAAWYTLRPAESDEMRRIGLTITGVIAGTGGLIAGLAMSGTWETVLLYLNQVPFEVQDPVFGEDIGFYIFSLPLYNLIVTFLIGVVIVTILVTLLATFMHEEVYRWRMDRSTFSLAGVDWNTFWQRFLPGFSLLLFLLFVLVGCRLWLARYELLYSATGVVYGAGYTDIHVTLPVLTILSALAFLTGIGFLVNIAVRRKEIVTYGLITFVAIAVIGAIASGAVQTLVVEPNEYNMERPYLGYNIESTLAAYNLDDVDSRIFPMNDTLTMQDIEENRDTIDNIRLWDWRPLQATYEQLQLFRSYYDFYDVDVDRYHIDGMYKEVLVSTREINTDELPTRARSWVNRHLVYTHGYGVVMNPVDRATDDGLPVFYIRDIPPESEYIDISEPRLYFAEETDDYVVVKTSTEEFDYPSGDENVYTSYSGPAGVPLDNTLKRFIYSVHTGSMEVLVSGSITPESRILLHRNIIDRAATIAPFLMYDDDPYPVISDGRIYWILDAYTTSSRYPYSQPVAAPASDGGDLNYIRNSVKVVIDAYTGDVNYYIVDPDDPLIATYEKIFPGLFSGAAEMPAGLREHIRYPQGIFSIQAAIYSVYHMQDPKVFYNKEDVWVVPDEIYRGSRVEMEPYYIIMKLPGAGEEEFILMLPFTPRNKQNLIGWMAARCDPPHYGDIVVYQFSKQELSYGPMQIEARIDQDPEISQLITLWSQAGSTVVRGNTLVIPIEDSIIYVEPLYLEATERGTLPQLQRVIIAHGDQLSMQPTLKEALTAVFGEWTPAEEGTGEKPPVEEGVGEILNQIRSLYRQAEEALRSGDLGRYQELVDRIGEVVG
ncbi:MAG: UPF0182 family membrane protein, partial [Methanoculleaceae archaeon]